MKLLPKYLRSSGCNGRRQTVSVQVLVAATATCLSCNAQQLKHYAGASHGTTRPRTAARRLLEPQFAVSALTPDQSARVAGVPDLAIADSSKAGDSTVRAPGSPAMLRAATWIAALTRE